jgi:hypothetical protein
VNLDQIYQTAAALNDSRPTWSEPLRNGAPYQQCDRCQRCTWDPARFGAGCRACGGEYGPAHHAMDQQ